MVVTTQAPFQLPDQPVDVDIIAMDFRGPGHPTRPPILETHAESQPVSELIDLIGSPQPKVSNHPASQRWCGFVESRREHRTVHYRIATSGWRR